jgi:predicted RNA-binding protein YlqC (UPF0109 family)
MVKELLYHVITRLVDTPQEVAITEQERDGRATLAIRVSSRDRAKVIGKEGRTLKAIRTLAAVVSSFNESDVTLESSE